MLYAILTFAFKLFDSVLATIFFLNFNGYKIKEKPAFWSLCPILIIITEISVVWFDIFVVFMSILVSFVFMMVCKFNKTTRLRCLWASVLFYGTLMLVNSIIYSIFQSLTGVNIMHLVERMDVYVAICIISKIFLLLTIKTYINIKERLEYKGKSVNILNLLFTSLFDILLIIIIMRITTVDLSFPLTLVMIGLFISGLIHFYMYAKLSGKARVELDYELLKQKTILDKKSFREKKNQLDNAKRMNHDIKNHLMHIEYYIRSAKHEKAINYIERIVNQMNSQPSNMNLTNDTLNYVLNYKIEAAIKLGINVTAQIEDIKECIIEDFDLCSLLSNILDNAIESSEKEAEKHIAIEIFNFSGYQAYSVKNRVENSVLTQNGALLSSKNDEINHGFGMKQIKNIINNYKGHIDIYEKEKYFNIMILIPRKIS